MKRDRLRKDYDDIENLDDLIGARDPRRNAFTHDVDSFEEDLQIPDDVDADAALTFPHPKRKKDENMVPEFSGTPKKEDVDFDFEDSVEEMLPADYSEDYNYATDTHTSDEDEEYLAEYVSDIDGVDAEDVTNEVPVRETPEVGGFNPEEAEKEEWESTGGI